MYGDEISDSHSESHSITSSTRSADRLKVRARVPPSGVFSRGAIGVRAGKTRVTSRLIGHGARRGQHHPQLETGIGEQHPPQQKKAQKKKPAFVGTTRSNTVVGRNPDDGHMHMAFNQTADQGASYTEQQGYAGGEQQGYNEQQGYAGGEQQGYDEQQWYQGDYGQGYGQEYGQEYGQDYGESSSSAYGEYKGGGGGDYHNQQPTPAGGSVNGGEGDPEQMTQQLRASKRRLASAQQHIREQNGTIDDHEGEIEKLRSELRASADAQHSSHTKSNKLLKLLLDITAYALEKAKESDALNNKWKAVTDPSTGKPYYHNEATGETRWDKPDDQMNDLVKYIRRMSNNGDGIALPGTLSGAASSPGGTVSGQYLTDLTGSGGGGKKASPGAGSLKSKKWDFNAENAR